MNTNLIKLLLCWILCLTNSIIVFSQVENNDTTFRVETYYEDEYQESSIINFLNIGIGAYNPQNAFGQKIDGSKFLFNLSYFRQIKRDKPFFAGFEFVFAPIKSYAADIDFINDEGFTETYEDRVNSNIFQFNFIGRYFLPLRVWIIDPFVEFSYGMQWYTTSSSITYGNDEEASEYDFIKNDLVGQYGIAAGLNFMVKENYYGLIRVGYYSGLSAFYYTIKEDTNFTIDHTIEYFDLQKTTTDMIKWDVGLTFAF